MAVSIIAAVVAAGVSAYSTAASSRAQAKAKRNAANASQLAAQGGGGSVAGATASRFADAGGDSMRMADLSKIMPSAQQSPSMPQPGPTELSATAPPVGSEPQETPLERMQREEQERRRRMGM